MTKRSKTTQAVALFLNLIGTILVALSFQATSSDFRLVSAHGYDVQGRPASPYATAYAICVNNYTIAATDSQNTFAMGGRNCPDWDNSRPSAVVTSEYPWLLYFGLVATMLGFLIQFLLMLDMSVVRKILGEPENRLVTTPTQIAKPSSAPISGSNQRKNQSRNRRK